MDWLPIREAVLVSQSVRPHERIEEEAEKESLKGGGEGSSIVSEGTRGGESVTSCYFRPARTTTRVIGWIWMVVWRQARRQTYGQTSHSLAVAIAPLSMTCFRPTFCEKTVTT